MNVLIIEDEILAADRLESLILKHDPSITICNRLDSVKDSVEYLKANLEKLDLIFMDIQLADGKSLEIFKEVDVSKPVIFTTAYNEYSLEAFNYNSIHYLLKPVKYEDLSNAIDKFSKLYQNKVTIDPDVINRLLTGEGNKNKERFLLKFGNRLISEKTENIALIYIFEKVVYCKIFNDDRNYMLDYSLEELEAILDTKLFYRVNRKTILNVNAIKSIFPYKNHRLNVVTDPSIKEEIIVSREKVNAFRLWLDS